MNHASPQRNIPRTKLLLVGVLVAVLGYVVWSTYLVTPSEPELSVESTAAKSTQKAAPVEMDPGRTLRYSQLTPVSLSDLESYCPFTLDGSAPKPVAANIGRDDVEGSDRQAEQGAQATPDSESLAENAAASIILETTRGKVAVIEGRLLRHGQRMEGANELIEIHGSSVIVKKVDEP